jgi:ferrous iron transport protein B
MKKTLKELQTGEKGYIYKVKGSGAFRKRILEMGFIPGREVSVIKAAPLSDPIEYRIMNYDVSLRKTEAALIEIVSSNQFESNYKIDSSINEKNKKHKRKINETKTLSIALVGNPNSGKTTFFNFASKSKEKVANYAGVTIEAKQSEIKYDGYTFKFIDLPGTYSLTAYSPEELYVREHIIETSPDFIINVVDATNLERNLYLTTQLMDMDVPFIVALNMHDEFTKNKDEFNVKIFKELTGIEAIPVVAKNGKGVKEILSKIIKTYENHYNNININTVNYGKEFSEAINNISEKIKISPINGLSHKISPRFIALKLLEKDSALEKQFKLIDNTDELLNTANQEVLRLEMHHKNDTESLMTQLRYSFISHVLKQTYLPSSAVRRRKSDKIDKFLTHKYFGIPLFLFFLWVMFYFTFTLGAYPMELIETGIEFLSKGLNSILHEGMISDLLVNGIIGGVGSVLVFLPNIVLLYFFISIMEDTGYMARAVFIMDKLMSKMGLNGKSFIPLMMGFGCNVPAILTARIIDSRKDRLITILINPFMSCSARLPVYVLLISAFFVAYKAWILFSIYLLGILLAVGSALLFSRTLFKKTFIPIPFIMELPPYRIPTAKAIGKHIWFSASQYLKKISGIILIASIIIWALGYFPQDKMMNNYYSYKTEQITLEYSELISQIGEHPEAIAIMEKERDNLINELELARSIEQTENSFISIIGNFIQPVLAPLGFDWKMSVSIITGIAAKEVVVSTMGILYQSQGDDDEHQSSLINKLQNQVHTKGKYIGERVFSPAAALAFMSFVLIYFPCIGVIAAIRKESGSWNWGIFIMVYTTVLAWVISFIVFNVANLFN